MKKKLSLLMVAFLTFAVILAGCGSDNKKAGSTASSSETSNKALSGKHYKLALNATFAPFESTEVDKNGDTKYVGFDMDLIKKMSKDLGFTYEVKDMEFKGLIGELQSGRADFVISGLSPTEERKKTVDFSDSYFNVKTAILYNKKNDYKTVSSLKGVKVATVFGTEYDNLAKSIGADTTSLDSSPVCMQELNNGRVEAVIMDASQAAVKCKENKDLAYSVVPAEDMNEGVSSTFAIAFPKDSKLVSIFNKEIKKLQDNGTIDKLTVKWMGKEFLKNE